MTWTPRDVVALVLVLTLAVAFDAVVIVALANGVLASDLADALAAGFLLLAGLLAAVLGVHLRGG